MSFIENISLRKIIKGIHRFDPERKSVLIQITDPDKDHVEPYHDFDEIYQFKFYDIDIDNKESNLFCTEKDAKQLVETLQKALKEYANVTVHCTAGLCRSGAVAEVGIMMGFKEVHRVRQPNRLVKTRMMKELGWTYD